MNTSNWVAWVALAMLYCGLTYNPFYQLLLFLTVCACALARKLPLKSYLKAGLLMSAIPLFINVFFVHLGKIVLFTVPRNIPVAGFDIPLLVFSGHITAEALAFAAIMALFLLNMLVSFQVFNGSTSPDAILRLMPAALPAVGLVTSIGLRFVPTILRDHSSIRDAQMSRGVKMGSGPAHERLANQAGVIAPTVVTALERGFNLAESMASRGYTGQRTKYTRTGWTKTERIIQAALILSVAVTVWAKLSGVMDFWPYDSAALPQLSRLAIAPLVALAIPLFTKDESNRT
ncbi:MAG: energy-coupling factor transporter transmembrane component T [Candidatus Altiarchaeota archaeon]